MLLSQFLPIFKVPHTSCFHKLFCPTKSGKLAQSNLYISIASGPGGAMLLIRLRIYRGFKYAIMYSQSTKLGPARSMLIGRLCYYRRC